MQQALKPASGAAWAEIVAAELFGQLDLAMDEAASTLDMGSEGKNFRRLRVMLKAGEVFEIAMFAHDTPPSLRARPIAAALRYHGAVGFGRWGTERTTEYSPPPSPTTPALEHGGERTSFQTVLRRRFG